MRRRCFLALAAAAGLAAPVAARSEFRAATGLVRQGAFRALAVSSAERVRALPAVPTLAEAGLPVGPVVGWHGIVAPAGTDPAICACLDACVQAALESTGIAARLVALALEPVAESPARLAETIRGDAERWGAVIRRARIVPA